MTEVEALLAALVRTPSPSGEEEAVVALLAEWLETRGVAARVEGRNLEARVGRGEPVLLLNSHTDTVPPGEGWTRDPFGAAVETVAGARRLYGRGSGDAKASVAAMAAALVRLRDLRGGTVVLAATCEEERGRGGFGAFRPSLGPLDGAIFGEPTGLRPAVAQRGLLVLELTARGRAGHAARPHLAVNAIEVAARDVVALAALDWPERDPRLGPTTLAVTRIQAGHAHNVIPDRCDLVVDLRTIPELSPEAATARVRAAVASEVRVRSDRFRPVATPPDSRLWAAVRAVLPEAEPFGSATLSDWAHLADAPGVKLGPGASERSHTVDEWVDLAEVNRAVTVYEAIARRFCRG